MLVLSRKKNESIIIKGDSGDIRIVVVEIDKGKVRFGIDAPRGYAIVREELVHEIKNANRLSAFDNLETIRKLVEDENE
jgi:carbon storage regulator